VATGQREREVLERSVHAITERARDAYALIEEIQAAGFPNNGPTVKAGRILSQWPVESCRTRARY